MPASDRADLFFNRIMPNITKINVPGYTYNSMEMVGGGAAFERILFFPESFFVHLENSIIETYGTEGRKRLYALGKKFGYRLASVLQLPRNDPNFAMALITKFLEASYAEKINLVQFDAEKKVVEFYTKGLAVTSKNGHGYILTVGGCAGGVGYLLNDYKLECSSKKISDLEYSLIAAYPGELEAKGMEVIECNDTPTPVDNSQYLRFNSPPDKPIGDLSLKRLIELGLISYNSGKMGFPKVPGMLIPLEPFLMLGIEGTFDENTVAAAAYWCFLEIGGGTERKKNAVTYIAEVLTGLGFGNIGTIDQEDSTIINITGYPWLGPDSEKANFAIIRNAIKGFVEGNSSDGGSPKKTCNISEVQARATNDKLVVSMKAVVS